MGETQRQNQVPDRRGKKRAGIKGMGTIRPAVWILIVSGLLAAGAAGGYIWNAQQYKTVFFPETVINGVDASGKTADQVESLINSEIEGYQLEITGRDQVAETITGKEINLHSIFDGSLEVILAEQNPYKWGKHCFEPSVYQVETMVGYDEGLFKEVVAGLRFFDPLVVKEPEDARLSDYISGVGYEIIPEIEGTLPDRAIVEANIFQAILNLQTVLSLETSGAYIAPLIRRDDKYLNEQMNLRNRYVQMSIIHQFGDQQEVLTGDQIHSWLTFGAEGGITLDEAEVSEYVADLAKRYNTAYQPKKLKTSYGEEVIITGGNYGWRINQSAECAAISEIIRSGAGQVREPIYSQTAASRGEYDYGDTYVEINLTAQHLYFYKDGSLVTESDFVSGNISKGWSTPSGAYPLTYKQRDATLKGEGYSTPVDYWMPFNGGIGMHDADWRYSFGGTIYKTNGSHGCINLPPAIAQTIYEEISAGVPVLCYYLDDTETSGTSEILEETTPARMEETVPVETALVETAPVETESEETSVAEEETSSPAEAEPESNEELPDINPVEETLETETTSAETEPAGPDGNASEIPRIAGTGS